MMVGLVIIFIFIVQMYLISREKSTKFWEYTNKCHPPEIGEDDIVFADKHSPITNEEIHAILSKKYRYYQELSRDEQVYFLKRVQEFIRRKVFIIKSKEGFKEMPVLVSAAAIQLTFGLKDYLLPFYQYVVIYPEEYISDHSLSVLAGNVQGNSITIAWNQFLQGCEDPADGSNVGLHEMSHALYFQKMIIEDNAPDFSHKYNMLVEKCQEAYHMEMERTKDLYSDYATTNMQEFWAESIELFFEKPAQMKKDYPEVYTQVKVLLNQDPFNPQSPVLHLGVRRSIQWPSWIKRVFQPRQSSEEQKN